MKRERDLDLFRSLMLEIENGKDSFEPISDEVADIIAIDRVGPPMSQEEAARLEMHLELIEEAGFVIFTRYVDGTWAVDRITGPGHDFLDSVRSPEIWAKTKDGALAAGGWTLSLLSDLAKGFVVQQIKTRTGIDL